MTHQEINDIKKVEQYFNQGVNRPMDKYYVYYNPITFYSSLKLRNGENK